jgi:hypothetical protein
MKDEMDGTGKEVFLDFSGFASCKQGAYLVRGLREIMPNLIFGVDDCDLGRSYYNVFLRELKKNNISHNIKFENEFEFEYFLRFDGVENQIRDGNDSFIFGIDALKFSKRRLLDEEGVGALKEKYKIRDSDYIVVAGSFHPSDIDFFKGCLNFLNKKEDFKFLVVPRKNINYFIDEFKRKDIRFETDDNIKGDKNFLIVKEKGALDDIYSVSDVVLLGNTFGFDIRDGQNPLEPAFYGKRMISGCDYREMNEVAFDGLKQSGLLKVIRSSDDIVKEMLRKSSNEDKLEAEKAIEFIKSWQDMEKVYANIVQRGIYNKFSSDDKNFLSKRQSYKNLRERFG